MEKAMREAKRNSSWAQVDDDWEGRVKAFSRGLYEQRAFRASFEPFDALGATTWSERARQELRASGESSRRREFEARVRLTPQELQIARMAAEGLTNREIGQRLYLSHRTVGSHPYRIFPKLGVTSRNQLQTVLSVQ